MPHRMNSYCWCCLTRLCVSHSEDTEADTWGWGLDSSGRLAPLSIQSQHLACNQIIRPKLADGGKVKEKKKKPDKLGWSLSLCFHYDQICKMGGFVLSCVTKTCKLGWNTANVLHLFKYFMRDFFIQTLDCFYFPVICIMVSMSIPPVLFCPFIFPLQCLLEWMETERLDKSACDGKFELLWSGKIWVGRVNV